MKSITVRIHPDGTIEAETHGMKGEECLAYVSPLEDLLAAETIASHFTDEYREQAVAATEADRSREAAPGARRQARLGGP